MVAHKGSPTLTGRVVTPPGHVFGDARLGDRKSEFEQFTVNAWGTPKWVLDLDFDIKQLSVTGLIRCHQPHKNSRHKRDLRYNNRAVRKAPEHGLSSTASATRIEGQKCHSLGQSPTNRPQSARRQSIFYGHGNSDQRLEMPLFEPLHSCEFES
jgi:hypothetical protein